MANPQRTSQAGKKAFTTESAEYMELLETSQWRGACGGARKNHNAEIAEITEGAKGVLYLMTTPKLLPFSRCSPRSQRPLR
jgi:hypothetical protein